MRARKLLRPLIGVLLCIVGFALAKTTPYREGTAMLEAGGCRMVTDLIDKGSDEVSGYVIVFHGVAANKKLMAYVGRSFAEQNLRVFVPDLPGHGRTPGPFSFSRAETCAETFTRQLISRRAIDPARTILAGHSMGGAIAVRLAAHIPVGGVVAISPAPMSTQRGIARYLLPFENAPPAVSKTLVISGSWEPAAVRETARGLVEGSAESSDAYALIPRATHVSLLFDPRAARASQLWAAKVLGLTGSAVPASLLPLAGSLLGFLGILLLAGPFIRETLGASGIQKTEAKSTDATRRGNRGATVAAASLPAANPGQESGEGPTRKNGVWGTLANAADIHLASKLLGALLESLLACAVAVAILHFAQPFSFVRLFDGGYFASFLVIIGVLLLAMRHKAASVLLNTPWRALLAAAVAALLVHMLVTVWFDATLSEAWLTWSRWSRFPALLIACLAYFAGEELVVNVVSPTRVLLRIVAALVLRGLGWLAMLFAIFLLHRGPILLLLLAAYLALFCVLQLAGMRIVRTETRSPAAAALFGAILLAGFCLVIFPVT